MAVNEDLHRTSAADDPAGGVLASFALGVGRWRDPAGRLVEHTMRAHELALTTADAPAASSQLMALRQHLLGWHVEVATVAGWGDPAPRSARGTIARLFAPEPPTLLAIDEIENHLHADLAARLLDVMRSVAGRTRIVVTTHSARVLRCFAPAEVRLVRRGRDGSTIVGVDDEPRLAELIRAGELGDLLQDGYLTGAP